MSEEIRIGVYLCHCGVNIAQTVDVAACREFAEGCPGVVVARDYKFMCSNTGQELIEKDIEEQHLNRVVVAACSPLMHELTFRHACEAAGLNQYLFQMANIREQCAWVHDDRPAATEKARALVNGAIRRVAYQKPLKPMVAKINPATLIIGAGIAGIQASLQLAKTGHPVYLVEREPTIGGKMALFDKTFPTLDCSACILTPKMVSVSHRNNIHLLTWHEVEGVSGFIGNYKVKVRKKRRFVDTSKCTGCGQCITHCPATRIPTRRQILMGGKVMAELLPAGGNGKATGHDWQAGRLAHSRDKSLLHPDSDGRERAGADDASRAGEAPAGTRSENTAPQEKGRPSPIQRYLKVTTAMQKISPDRRKMMRTGRCSGCGYCVEVCKGLVGAHALEMAVVGQDERGRDIKRPMLTSFEACIACGACARVCPTGYISVRDLSEREGLVPDFTLSNKTAVYLPFPQAVPKVPIIDPEACIHMQTGECGVCKSVCEPDAIDFDEQEETREIEVGQILVSTGYQLFAAEKMQQFGRGRFDNVLSSLEFEMMLNSNGPTGGKVLMKNGKEPRAVGIIHCIGSRDVHHHRYCSRVCCMYALKFAHLVRDRTKAKVYQFHIDVRAFGKGYEEFYSRVLDEGVNVIRGKVGEVVPARYKGSNGDEGCLVVRCEDTFVGKFREIPVDMLILCNALEPQDDCGRLANLLGLSRSPDGFLLERHPKLDPVGTNTGGVYLAGTCQGPKDIPDTVAQAQAAAAQILATIAEGEVEIDPIRAEVNEDNCSGCRMCNNVCPYQAITFDEEKRVSSVNETLCKGCGTCVATCPAGAITGWGYTDEQILAELEAVLA